MTAQKVLPVVVVTTRDSFDIGVRLGSLNICDAQFGVLKCDRISSEGGSIANRFRVSILSRWFHEESD